MRAFFLITNLGKTEINPLNLQLKTATQEDIPFVFRLLHQGAKNGRYGEHLKTPKEARIATNSWVLMGADRRTGNPVKVVVAWKDDQRVGAFSLAGSKVYPDLLEIGFFSIADTFRRKGFGSILLNSVLTHWAHQYDLKAHCLKASEDFYRMLIKKGFRLVSESDTASKVVYLEKTSTGKDCLPNFETKGSHYSVTR